MREDGNASFPASEINGFHHQAQSPHFLFLLPSPNCPLVRKGTANRNHKQKDRDDSSNLTGNCAGQRFCGPARRHEARRIHPPLRKQPPLQRQRGSLRQKFNSGVRLQGSDYRWFYSVMHMPSAVKIRTMGERYRRIHHAITWNNCVPKIIRPEYRKPDIVRGDRRKRGRSRKKLLAIPAP